MTRRNRIRRHEMATAHALREDNRTGVKRTPQLSPFVGALNGPVTVKPPRRKWRRLIARASRRANR